MEGATIWRTTTVLELQYKTLEVHWEYNLDKSTVEFYHGQAYAAKLEKESGTLL